MVVEWLTSGLPAQFPVPSISAILSLRHLTCLTLVVGRGFVGTGAWQHAELDVDCSV